MTAVVDDPISLYQLPSDRYPEGANWEAKSAASPAMQV